MCQGQAGADMILVPRHPTDEMIEAGWASALAEDAEGVWLAMVKEWLASEERKQVQG